MTATIQPQTSKEYRCKRCGHVQRITTNHYGECYSLGHYNCCPSCPPWAKYPEFGGATTWECIEPRNQQGPPVETPPVTAKAETTTQERFSREYGIPLNQVFRLVRLANKRAKAAEHECNGDPHSTVADRSDKNANAQAWGADCERVQEHIDALVSQFGLTADYGVGLFPHLIDAQGRDVQIPY